MGRPKEENFKPVAVRKEDSGAEKIRKRKLKEEENGRLSSSMAKFTKKCLPISISMSITDSGNFQQCTKHKFMYVNDVDFRQLYWKIKG